MQYQNDCINVEYEYNRSMIGRMKPKHFLIPLFSLIFLVWGQATFAQNSGQRYFPETDYWVSGDFLEFFQAAGQVLAGLEVGP